LFSKAKREMWSIVLGMLLGVVLSLLLVNVFRKPQIIIEEVPVNQYVYSPYYWGLGERGGSGGSYGYSGGIAHHSGHGGHSTH
jgi:hypothetical protein